MELKFVHHILQICVITLKSLFIYSFQGKVPLFLNLAVYTDLDDVLGSCGKFIDFDDLLVIFGNLPCLLKLFGDHSLFRENLKKFNLVIYQA